MYPLITAIQPYAWGSREGLARLQGRPYPTAAPEAELWIGAHPAAPSRVDLDGQLVGLDELIADQPERMLGEAALQRFGPVLPFLLKILAVGGPLSIQVHPNSEQARAGFDREQAAGLSPVERNYADPFHKPEMIYPLGDFAAFCGFRAVDDTIELLAELNIAWLAPIIARLRAGTMPGEIALEWLAQGAERCGPQVADVVAACGRLERSGSERWQSFASRLIAVAGSYPADPGVLVGLLLNYVELGRGEPLFLGAGLMHAYLDGMGVELMAASDNVLRGGLTPKRIDLAELGALMNPAPTDPAPLPTEQHGTNTQTWPVPVDDFQLLRVTAPDAASVRLDDETPRLVLVTSGTARLHGPGRPELVLGPGEAAFVPAQDEGIAVASAGANASGAAQAEVFVAQPNL